MKKLFSLILLLLSLQAWPQDIMRVTKAEFERHRNKYNQLFDTTALPSAERLQEIENYRSSTLNNEESLLFTQSNLTIHVGRFLPSGIKGVFIQHPDDGFSRIHLNDMLYSSVRCDTYGLSRDGFLAAGYYLEDSLQGYLSVYSLQGWELLSVANLKVPFTPFDFHWTSDHCLYFRGGYDYFKIKIHPPAHRENCIMDDLEISHNEFLAAQTHAQRYNIDRYDRLPTSADTAAALQYAGSDAVLYAIVLEELYSGQFGQGGPAFVELGAGDHFCTRLLSDTLYMQSSNMVFSRDHLFAGLRLAWGGSPDEPAFIYIYPYPADSRHVAPPFVYQTTPAWQPTGSVLFWGEGGWLYVEGWNPRTQQSCYHKVRPPLRDIH